MDSPSDQTATATNVRQMSRARLVRYVNDIIRIQNTPLSEIILEHALLHLPAQPLLRLRSVSRSFHRRISSPFFSHVHSLTHRSVSGFFFHTAPSDYAVFYFFAFDPASDSVPDPTLSFIPDVSLTLLSSSNGLVAVGSGLRYYVCNPATTKCAAIPQPPPLGGTCTCTLVYHPTALNFSADFHLICMTPKTLSLHVFSSASAEWRRSNVRVPPPAVEGKWASVAVDGVAYWRAKDDSVVSYDPAADELTVIEPPPWGAEEETRWQLGEVGGKLCCVGGREGILEVYELVTEDNGAAWRKRTAVEVDGDPWPLICQGTDDRVLYWMDEMILRIDLRSRESRVMRIGVPEECVNGLPYISSLVGVKEFGSD